MYGAGDDDGEEGAAAGAPSAVGRGPPIRYALALSTSSLSAARLAREEEEEMETPRCTQLLENEKDAASGRRRSSDRARHAMMGEAMTSRRRLVPVLEVK